MYSLQCSDEKKSCSCPLKAVLIINLSKLRFVVKQQQQQQHLFSPQTHYWWLCSQLATQLLKIPISTFFQLLSM